MKRKFILSSALIALSIASPAWALKVTNLDHVPHIVLFESTGAPTKLTIAPGEAQYIVGSPIGRLSLITPGVEKIEGGAIQAQGILRKYIGNGRNQSVPAEPEDQFVVWPDGQLMLQRRVRTRGRG